MITEWSEHIFERQEGEVDREWRYKEFFLNSDFTLRECADCLGYAFTKQHADDLQTEVPINKKYDEFLKEHPIKFHPYDIKKGKSPSEEALQHWSAGLNIAPDCEGYTWIEIRSAKREYENKIAQETVKDMLMRHAVSLADIKINGLYRRERLKKRLNFEKKLTLSQDKAGSEADLSDLQFLKDISADDVKEFKGTLDMTGGLEVKSDLQADMERFQQKIREGQPKKRLSNLLEDKGIL